jgi:hypothetical protein
MLEHQQLEVLGMIMLTIFCGNTVDPITVWSMNDLSVRFRFADGVFRSSYAILVPGPDCHGPQRVRLSINPFTF